MTDDDLLIEVESNFWEVMSILGYKPTTEEDALPSKERVSKQRPFYQIIRDNSIAMQAFSITCHFYNEFRDTDIDDLLTNLGLDDE